MGRDAGGREELVRRFGGGDLVANATLQPGLDVLETSYGFWAYRRVHDTWVTLGGPVCAPEDRGAMLDRLLAETKRPLLCYVRDDVLASLDAAVGPGGARSGNLRARGLYAAGMGRDHHLDVPRLLSAPGPEVRSAVRQARRARIELRPFELDSLDRDGRARLEAISRAYLAKAEVGREMSFLNRPLSLEPDGQRQAFWLEERGRIFGVAVVNPIFDGGLLTAYLLDVLRFEKTRVWGVWLSTVHALAERMAARGLGLSVGFCPLHGVSRPPHGASVTLSWQMERLAALVESAKYLRRLRELKSLVPHTSEPRYFAGRSRSAVVSLYYFMEALGVGFGTLFGPDLLRVLRRGVGRPLDGSFASDPGRRLA